MIRSYLALALPLALIWVGLTNRPTLPSLLLGYGVGLALLLLLRPQRVHVNWRRLPGQVVALVGYVAVLYRDIFLSGIDVARRVLSPRIPLKLGIIVVPTQDPDGSQVITALSADSITLTPGQLVVELDENQNMYIHCLDLDMSAPTADKEQARRLVLLKRIIGR